MPIVTRQQAAALICPMPASPSLTCEADACMAWQWANPPAYHSALRLCFGSPHLIGLGLDRTRMAPADFYAAFRALKPTPEQFPGYEEKARAGWRHAKPAYEFTDEDSFCWQLDLVLEAEDKDATGYCGLAPKVRP